MRKVFILLSLLVVGILAAKADASEWQTTYKQGGIVDEIAGL